MAEETESGAGSSNPLAEQSGETLVMWGALIVLAAWIIFEVIAEEYFIATSTVAVALLIVVLPRIDVAAITNLTSATAFMKLAGYLLVALGLTELVSDIRNNIFDAGGATIFGAIVAYVGYVITFLGARKA
ncbi:MAG: hypothetical protein QNJ77_14410 [Acidimicrobiia bacterium]|nr:hypothetical protein [Acidimicrobiia bacterium]